MFALLADAIPTWTTKEVLYVIGGIASGIAIAAYPVYQLLTAPLRDRLRNLCSVETFLTHSGQEHDVVG